MDRNRPNRPRPPRPPAPRPQQREGDNTAASNPPRVVPPTNYREHLESEHSAKVVEEKGWPTEVKRFFLVRDKDGKEQQIASFTGTLPEALDHFYRFFHPQRSR